MGGTQTYQVLCVQSRTSSGLVGTLLRARFMLAAGTECSTCTLVCLPCLPACLSQAWREMFAAQSMKEEMFVDTPEGRVSLWDLLMYVRGNPELESLVARDLNLAVPVEGMSR